jgi:hypothetical protein
MVSSPRSEAFCKRTKATSTLIGCLKRKFIMKRFKMRQRLNKVCRDLSVIISVASVCLGDGGPPSDSSKLPYGIDVFLGIATGSVYFLTVALTAAYLSCMFIVYAEFEVQIICASPSSRHSYYYSWGVFLA